MCKKKMIKMLIWLKKHYILSSIIGVLFTISLFIWNLIDADQGSVVYANHFTAISGWVSFLGTICIGIIAIVQTYIYSKETGVTNEKTSKLAASIAETSYETAQLTASIKELIWKLNLPVLEISQTDGIIEFYQDDGFPKEELWIKTHQREFNSIVFNLCKDADHQFNNCQRIYSEKLVCTITNRSDNDINNISILDFKRRENNRLSSYSFDLCGYVQGNLGAHMSSRLIFKVFSSEKIYTTYYDDLLELVFTLQVTDANGDKSNRTFQVISASMQNFHGFRKGTVSMNFYPSVKA